MGALDFGKFSDASFTKFWGCTQFWFRVLGFGFRILGLGFRDQPLHYSYKCKYDWALVP